jgi:hypothetical protein
VQDDKQSLNHGVLSYRMMKVNAFGLVCDALSNLGTLTVLCLWCGVNRFELLEEVETILKHTCLLLFRRPVRLKLVAKLPSCDRAPPQNETP